MIGYRPWPGTRCPYCGDGHGAIEDGGGSEYIYTCWCGAKAKVSKDDPDIIQAIREIVIAEAATASCKAGIDMVLI